jgi:MinD superfamily P-loop ATPase
MERVLGTTAHFRVAALVCINKADIYPAGTAQIEAYCQARNIEVVGRIPFDATMTEAMVQGQPATAFSPDARASQALIALWQRIAARISEQAAWSCAYCHDARTSWK